MWLIIGLVIGAGLLALVLWLHSRKIAVTWYEWLVGAIGLLLLFFTIQNFTTSFAEHEPTAAWRFLLVLGLPSVILLAIACLLPWWHHRRAG
jgi:uncharacterized membrane protein